MVMNPNSSIVSTEAPARPEPGTALETKAKEYKAQALTVTKIADTDGYKKAWALLRGGAGISKEIEAFFAPIKADAHKAWQNNCKREKVILDPIVEGKNHLSKMVESYDAEQERLRLIKEAEQRVEIAKAADDQMLAEAEARNAEGDAEGALALIDQGHMTMASPVIARETPKPIGGHFRSTWRAELKGETLQEQQASKMELIKAVAAGHAPIMALEVNFTYLNQRATSDKKLFSIPGVVAKENRKAVART